MKKILLLCIGAVFVINVYSQNYVPFPESGATWRVDKASCVYCTGNINCTCSKYQYTLQGDTTVGSYTYKKIHREWEDIDEFEVTDSGYVGAIRQDIPNKKVYYLIPNTSIDTLLYDFDLSLGDTVPASYVYEFHNAVVGEIDSILIGPDYHKIYTIQGFGDKLIEGIGSTAGFIETLFVFEVYHILRCYSLSSGYQYVFPGAQNCDIITGIPITNKNTLDIVLPNPLNDASVLNFDCEHNNKYQVYIYNSSGENMKNIQFTCENKSYPVTLKKDDFKSGIYYYSIHLGDKMLRKGKFLVQ